MRSYKIHISCLVPSFGASADPGDLGSIPGSGRSPGVGNGNLLQHSCLENSVTEEPGRLQSMKPQRAGHDWIHVRTHTCERAHTCASTHMQTLTYTRMHTHVHTRANTCTHAHPHIHACTHIRTRAHIRVHTHAHRCTHAHACTHTHTHTYPFFLVQLMEKLRSVDREGEVGGPSTAFP